MVKAIQIRNLAGPKQSLVKAISTPATWVLQTLRYGHFLVRFCLFFAETKDRHVFFASF